MSRTYQSRVRCFASQAGWRGWSWALLLAALLGLAAGVAALAAAPASGEGHGRLVLVLPFHNHSGQAGLDWVGESFPEIMNERLAAAGFLPIGRADRLYALDHLGLPLDFQPSHASTLRLAQMLDADYVVVGWYELAGDSGTAGSASTGGATGGKQLKATAHVLDVTALTLGPAIVEQADLVKVLNVDNSVAWRVAKEIDPGYSVAEQTFIAADAGLGVDAFEHYIRGLVGGTSEERIKHLQRAVQVDSDFALAWYALGRACFADGQYELAATALGHLPKDDPNALSADFYRGLAYFTSGNYLKAEDAFAFVTTRQPLPEVVNNQGVAASRRGKDATALFEQAVAADPKDPDYHFNLAVSLRARNDIAGAEREVQQALKLRPEDAEAQGFDAALRALPVQRGVGAGVNQGVSTPGGLGFRGSSGAGIAAASGAGGLGAAKAFTPGSGPDAPLERIKRTYNEASFRQAAFALDQMEDMRLSSLKPADRAAALDRDGMQFLNRGLMLEAERQFNAALEADASSADAHAGLAQVRERTGDTDAARTEAAQSLKLRQNAAAHLVLARLDLQAKQLDAAAGEVRQALSLDPADAAAKGIQQALDAQRRGP